MLNAGEFKIEREKLKIINNFFFVQNSINFSMY